MEVTSSVNVSFSWAVVRCFLSIPTVFLAKKEER